MTQLLIGIAVATGLGLFFGIVLSFVHKFFRVDVDPKIEKILGHLPGANCGACGMAGCQAAAEAIAHGDVPPNVCPPNDEENTKEIAALVGGEAAQQTKLFARIHCSGGVNAKDKFEYNGLKTCSADVLQGGHKVCSYGCLGHGDCLNACPFDAITMLDGLPQVSEEKCTGCGKCVSACPRSLIELLPETAPAYVKCSSHDRGPAVKKGCSTGCIGCGLCVKAAPEMFKLDNFLARTVEGADTSNLDAAATKCPVKVIIQTASAQKTGE